MKKDPSLWCSLARIIACGCIFLYHFLVLHHAPTYGLATWGLGIFFFLSGWFSVSVKESPWTWFLKRLRRILIPYWPVIILVLVANRVVGYKETTLLNDILTFLGFSLFVDDPVYVISWFITIMILLDFSLYLFHRLTARWLKAVYLAALIVTFNYFLPELHNALYLFYIGHYLNVVSQSWPSLNQWLAERHVWYRVINSAAFRVQNYTYSFFLIHGAVLIFTIRFLGITGSPSLLMTVTLSLIAAYIHNRVLRRFS